METTPNLSLPYIMPSQAQKHVTHNEALQTLDSIVQLAVLDRDLSVPPAAPSDGERYIIAADATGEWAEKDGWIAARQDGGWIFLRPQPGWLCLVVDEETLLFWTGAQWQGAASAPGALQNVPLLGLGTSADAVNPLSAKLNKALWAALTTTEGGNGDLRYTLNKQGPDNVLSLLMQSNWSGRAEIGLVGNDDLSIRVSADGSTWRDVLTVDRTSGKVALPASDFLSNFAVSLLSDSGRFAGNDARTQLAGPFVFPSYLTAYNGSTVADGGKFITDNNDYGGTAGVLDPNIRDLIDKIREPAYRRYGVEFHAALITMGSGTASSPVTLNGAEHYLSLFLTFGPRAPAMTFHAYVCALDGPIVYLPSAGQTIFKNGVKVSDTPTITNADGWASITVFDQQNSRESWDYSPTPLTLYAQEGHRYLMACPALMGGLARVDDSVGIISGINRWLP